MSHRDALQLLIPVDLGGVFAGDLTVEGLELDLAAADIEALRQTIITDTYTLIPDAIRIKMVPVKWDIKKPFYVALAAALGYTIYIRDYTGSMSAWHCAGDEVLEEPWEYFTAGCALAGDYLAQEDTILPWIWEVMVTQVPDHDPVPGLEAVLTALKPAHLQLNFTYL